MKMVRPSVELLYSVQPRLMMQAIEMAGRTCYKSEDKMTPGSSEAFVRRIIKSGHESVLEHEKISLRVVCDRGVSHEIVRHRLASYSQESTRYCNYKGGVSFVIPCWMSLEPEEQEYGPVAAYGSKFNGCAEAIWYRACMEAEKAYMDLLKEGWSPQMARSVLPNSLKTEIVMTMNLRELRHFLRLRTSKAAHPQMREVAFMILKMMMQLLPAVFDDVAAEVE